MRHPRPVDVVDLLSRMGGIATRSALVRGCGRAAVDRAVAHQRVVRLSHGRYGLPELDAAVAAAHARSATLCLASAALAHGWAVKAPPARPQLTVRRNRKLSPTQRAGVEIHRHDLAEDDVDGIVTSRETTLLQCLRSLPFDEALAIADSALRDGEELTLQRVAARVRGPGSVQVRRVARLASPAAANPFESTLRAIALDIGLAVRPQVGLAVDGEFMRPDLVDTELRLILEADSFSWHGSRSALARDARRYNLMVADGWLVLRFSYEQVMFRPHEVRRVLESVVARRTECTCRHPCRAS